MVCELHINKAAFKAYKKLDRWSIIWYVNQPWYSILPGLEGKNVGKTDPESGKYYQMLKTPQGNSESLYSIFHTS